MVLFIAKRFIRICYLWGEWIYLFLFVLVMFCYIFIEYLMRFYLFGK